MNKNFSKISTKIQEDSLTPENVKEKMVVTEGDDNNP